jgi:hypothetical protein
MATRRSFSAGLMATGVIPLPSWADVGNPAFLAAAKLPDETNRLFGLDAVGTPVFSVALPDRGHAAAAHPTRPEAIAFARRPGIYAIGVQCDTGEEFTRFTAPSGRHFYGHGVFASDAKTLLTPLNDFEAGIGRIAFWDASAGYEQKFEIESGGVGPHDIARLPDGLGFVVANGGIETHPEMGRAKLNIPEMKPNLSYLALNGGITEKVELDPSLHKNSIRHLAVRQDGLIAFAMQWQGPDEQTVPLLGLHKQGGSVQLLSAPDDLQRRMRGYGASVAFSGDGTRVAVSSSIGGLVTIFDVDTGAFRLSVEAEDVSGLAAAPSGFWATTGQGRTIEIGAQGAVLRAEQALSWDNHLVSL